MLYYEAIIDYVKRCPGPHFRELTRELGIPVGTLQYWLSKLLEADELYPLRLAQRPRTSTALSQRRRPGRYTQ